INLRFGGHEGKVTSVWREVMWGGSSRQPHLRLEKGAWGGGRVHRREVTISPGIQFHHLWTGTRRGQPHPAKVHRRRNFSPWTHTSGPRPSTSYRSSAGSRACSTSAACSFTTRRPCRRASRNAAFSPPSLPSWNGVSGGRSWHLRPLRRS